MTPKNDDGYEGNGVNLLSEYHKPGAGFVPVEYNGDVPEWVPNNSTSRSTAAGWLGLVVYVVYQSLIPAIVIGGFLLLLYIITTPTADRGALLEWLMR